LALVLIHTLCDRYWGASSAQHARQLVHDNVWATLSTISVQFNGIPYGSTVSYSGEWIVVVVRWRGVDVYLWLDGIGYSKEDSTGKMFFYLTPMDATGETCLSVRAEIKE
jgi:hypothetical protein